MLRLNFAVFGNQIESRAKVGKGRKPLMRI